MTPKTKTVVTVDLDENELATVLAALRYFQDEFDNVDAKGIYEAFPLHFRRADDTFIEPLGSDDISTLCQQINAASETQCLTCGTLTPVSSCPVCGEPICSECESDHANEHSIQGEL